MGALECNSIDNGELREINGRLRISADRAMATGRFWSILCQKGLAVSIDLLT